VRIAAVWKCRRVSFKPSAQLSDRRTFGFEEVCVDASQPHLWYIAGYGSNIIYMFNSKTDELSRVDSKSSLQWKYPTGIACTRDGKTLYVSDCWNHSIRSVDVESGAASRIVGSSQGGFHDGTRAIARFYYPCGLALIDNDEKLVVSDHANNAVRMVDLKTLDTVTVAGNKNSTRTSNTSQGNGDSKDGVGREAQFSVLRGIRAVPNSRCVIVADTSAHCFRVVDITDRRVTTIGGKWNEAGYCDGTLEEARFNNPRSCCAISKTSFIVLDENNGLLRAVDTSCNAVSTIQLINEKTNGKPIQFDKGLRGICMNPSRTEAVITTIEGIYMVSIAFDPIPLLVGILRRPDEDTPLQRSFACNKLYDTNVLRIVFQYL
jgi:DNA-binding beta-propeller fold protein YncE